MASAEELYGIVERYAGFGLHHTGTEPDWATARWLVERLRASGGEADIEPFDVDRYVVAAELRSGAGEPIPSVPVFYSAVGHVETDDVTPMAIDGRIEGGARGLDAHLDRLAGEGVAAAALALSGPTPHPIQCNRVPVVRSGPPAIIVAADRLRDVPAATLTFTASTEPATAPNVVATVGPTSARPVTVTTPLSGWTPAAGERGTGLAAALALTADLAADHQVRFVACSGHELDHLGLERYLASRSVDADAVIHLGASVGAVEWVDGEGVLDRGRAVFATADGETRADLADLAAVGNWTLRTPDPWPGEGGTWRAAGARVLSFVGGSALFHTVGDVPEAATTPEAMATAAEVVVRTTRRFLAS
ncbi:MAG: hypothetical protein AAGA93_21520 [Actinomycetota bacterium]